MPGLQSRVFYSAQAATGTDGAGGAQAGSKRSLRRLHELRSAFAAKALSQRSRRWDGLLDGIRTAGGRAENPGGGGRSVSGRSPAFECRAANPGRAFPLQQIHSCSPGCEKREGEGHGDGEEGWGQERREGESASRGCALCQASRLRRHRFLAQLFRGPLLLRKEIKGALNERNQ